MAREHTHVTNTTDADDELVDDARATLDVADEIEAKGGHATILEPAPGAVAVAASGHPRLARAWVTAWPFAKLALYGAAFVAGGYAIARVVGPRAAHDLGERGGEGFAEGVVAMQRRLHVVSGMPGEPANLRTRGARWR